MTANSWELDAVEVRPRTRPVPAMAPLAPAVQQVLAQQGVGLEGLSAYLREHGLALLVSLMSRRVTARTSNNPSICGWLLEHGNAWSRRQDPRDRAPGCSRPIRSADSAA